MSLDYEIWSVSPLSETTNLPNPSQWILSEGGWSYITGNWQIVINPFVEIDEQDIPEEVSTSIAGIRYTTSVNLEPVHAPRAAHSLARQVVRAIAQSCRGIVVNTDGEVILSGQRRRIPTRPKETQYIDTLQMMWCFTEGPLTTREGASGLISYFQKHVPEFLPRRYGPYEPLPFRFDATNLEPFLDFVLARENPLFPVVRTQGKWFDVDYALHQRAGWEWRAAFDDYGFFVPYLRLCCPIDLLEDVGWELALRRCWRAVSDLAKPFYGEVRVVKGYVAQGSCLASNLETEDHTVTGCWRGLPARLGQAAVLGEPYLSLWPEFMSDADIRGGLAFHSLSNWRDRRGLEQKTGSPPDGLCQPGEPRWVEGCCELPWARGVRTLHKEYPHGIAKIWPFSLKPTDPPQFGPDRR